ncbi:protein of unknown function [Taphrina deformans PYCC 5710]|uniref:Uncharacterized protein n=1 Tax=Taphrina deformans (strain PYCC 5710 / ATCC 11124 / CBS 356.35 / IMI 108563 / JCM 9778 / NBRC 8474) TaxID=1097556 RepID=R4XLK9_TAPDE|nr:protein of unknown function [Taphrina deformans PYCC 5710]|eukprot:CCG84180.1 protein of unknown function [Taphrina deformans PYCC 5710]
MLASEEEFPAPPPLRRTVTYSDRRTLDAKEVEEIRDLQRRRTESRRGRSRQQGSPIDGAVEGESEDRVVALGVPKHKLSRDGIHYVSPYPSPVGDAIDLTAAAAAGAGVSRQSSIDEALSSTPDQVTVDTPLVSRVPGLVSPDILVRIGDVRRTRSPLKQQQQQQQQDGSRYPDYRAVPSAGRETVTTSRNITDDAESLLEQETGKLSIE